MNAEEILILDDAIFDLEIGREFYDSQETGDYFKDSLLSDLESSMLYAGIHQKKYGLHRMAALNIL